MDIWEYLQRYNYLPGSLHDVMDNGKLFMEGAGSFGDWFGSLLGLTDDDKAELEYVMADVPIVGDFMRARDDYNRMDDYLRNTGQSWSSMRYPTLAQGSGLTGGLQRLSSNVLELYDDPKSKPRNKPKRDSSVSARIM